MRSLLIGNTANTIIVAQVTQVEVVSGLSRLHREGNLVPHVAHSIRLLLDRHMKREYMIIQLTDPIIQVSETLLEKHPLRAYDAIQLASALESNAQLIGAGLGTLTFITGDTRLLTIALAEGLTVDNPNNHP